MSRPYVSTYTGGRLHLDTINHHEITTEVLAHHLALVNRWNGSTKEPYSVAQHSLWVASIVPPDLRLAALLHDASEAYIQDLSRTVKSFIAERGSGYADLEARIMLGVGRAYGLDDPKKPGEAWWLHSTIKRADDAVLLAEARDLLVHTPDWAVERIPSEAMRDTIVPFTWQEAKRNFAQAIKDAFEERQRWLSGAGFRSNVLHRGVAR